MKLSALKRETALFLMGAVLIVSLFLLRLEPTLLIGLLTLLLLLTSWWSEEILLFTLALAVLVGQLYRFSLGGLTFAPLDLAVLWAVVYYGQRLLSAPAPFLSLRQSPLFWPILLLSFWLSASWLFSLRIFTFGEALFGFLYLGRFLVYLALLLLLSVGQKASLFHRWTRLLLTSIALLGFFQFWFFPDLRLWERAGWDPHLGRLTASFFDPNLLASFLLLGLFFLLTEAGIFKGLILFLLAAFFFTLSRSGWLAFGVGVLGGSLGQKKWLFLSLLLLWLAGVFLWPAARARAVDFLSFGPTLEARVENLKEGWEIFRREPFWGIGFNNLKAWRVKKEDPGQAERSASGLDNSFLLVLSTAGVFGFLLYLWFYGGLVRRFWVTGQTILAFGILALGIQSLFVNALFYPANLLLLAFILASHSA